MKKPAIIASLVLVVPPAFAAAAMVLPAGVFRISAVPSYGFAPGSYNTSGTYAKFGPSAGSAWVFVTGLALEGQAEEKGVRT
jgi:hypothetical protein